jgi:polar amino acid transport system substrate-binding protein
MMQQRWIWLVLAGLATAGTLYWWFTVPSQFGSTLARIQQEGVIRIGYAVEAPYVFLNAKGELAGAEIEVARIVAARLAIPRIEWCQTEFGSLITELEAGRFDAIAAGMFITPERARRVSFSEPTFRVSQALLVRAGNPHEFHAYEDVAKPPLIKIAVLHGSIEEAMIRQMGVPETGIVAVSDALTGRVAVESGLAGGLALSSPTVRFMVRQQMLGLTEVAQPFSQPALADSRLTGFGAVVFRKTDDDLRQAWNRQLREFIGSAEHRGLFAEFGFSDHDLPAGLTTAEILSSGAK